ncbi:DUF4279 domain-containing protein [Pseudomonas sp. 6D_7.1_Bac1]|jgi:hypothetical protein|uniref:DUF4279 domain-containing protein n=1 Tax=Pseudomonas sp. 6D_7.1_Bac1 TaxID=2971615 RepID=UPI0021CA5BD0|nr:DUF4279 domain-containing protein [Pseudomonas sp. 6D_7.1_Bac1]MCU1752684.1 DUF4279 domain-containing protein [Pseudomonas sp. 6D_7.1_Bac1]
MENYVRLVATSNCLSSEQIVRSLNIRGERVWDAGDRRGNTAILESESGWVISSTAGKSLGVDVHIKSIMGLVSGLESDFKKFSEIPGCEVQISCAIYGSGAPPLSFSKAIVEWVGRLGASLDIDIYRI